MQSNIDPDIYVRMPDGCDELSGKTVKLAKHLAKLKQSLQVFEQLLTSTCNLSRSV